MSFNERVGSLKRKHAEIEARLHEEVKYPYHNPTTVRSLKIQKLHLKEEIERLNEAAA